MMKRIRFCTLFSGSSANCTYVEADGKAILFDVGAGIKKTGAALAEIDSCFDRVEAVFITHEHTDHISGLASILRKHRIPVLANERTLQAIHAAVPDIDTSLFRVMPTGSRAVKGAFSVRSVATLHDSAESVGYFIDVGNVKLGVLTDTGEVTAELVAYAKACHALVLESNHDAEMLRTGPYPYSLKQRIGGRYGHLSNKQCAEFLIKTADTGKQVLLAHLSKENNTPSIAVSTVKNRLLEEGISTVRVAVAPADGRSPIIEFGEDICCASTSFAREA